MHRIAIAALLAAAIVVAGLALATEDQMSQPKLFRVVLQVPDLERAVAFYRTVLEMDGFRVSNGRHYFDLNGTILACYDPRADGDAFEAQPNPDRIYIAVDDLEATLAACERAEAGFSDAVMDGGKPSGEIAVRPWGERSFYVKDPAGNRVCFVDRRTMFTGGDEM